MARRSWNRWFGLSSGLLDPIGSQSPTLDLFTEDIGTLFRGVTEKMVPPATSSVGRNLDLDVFVKTEHALVAQRFNAHDARPSIEKDPNLFSTCAGDQDGISRA
jgi:hypothetical protein